MRTAIYARLSRDTGTSSIDRQQHACEALCNARGWTVVGHYTDNDTSAYLPKTRRPEFERLLEDIAAEALDMVVVFKIDRLVRRPSDFERFWDEAEYRAVNLTSVTEPIDSSNPHGVAFIRILVALAGLESATSGLRISAQRREEAFAGRRGSSKAYGLNDDWTELVEHEAALIREAANRVLAGERVAAITRDWRERGVPSPSGRAWADAVLNQILHNPRIAGDRAYRGTVVATDCFPAVLDRRTFDQLQTELGQPRRQGRPVRHPPRLASGIIVCGRCGSTLMQTTRSGRLFYSCPHPPTGCAVLHVNADYADDFVRTELCARAQHVDPPQGSFATNDIARSLAELATDYYALHRITRDEFIAARSNLESSAPPPSRDIARLTRALLRAEDPVAVMRRIGVETQRMLLRRYVVTILVHPAPRRGKFDPSRLQIVWREHDVHSVPAMDQQPSGAQPMRSNIELPHATAQER
jgi:site-specific DNA recombinase